MQMKKIVIIICMLILFAPIKADASDGSSYVYDGYIYDFWGNALDSPAAFTLERVIDESNLEGIKLLGVDDVCASKDGRIFIVDTLESRVNVFDEEGQLLRSLKVIRGADGKIVTDAITGNQLILTSPQGVFVHEKNKEIYIADTGAYRIVVLDSDEYTFKRIIERPANMTGVTEFKPSKIVVDHADRIYVVVQSSYEGIIELNGDGSFSRYFGVTTPRVNLIDYFWKSIASDEQKAQMSKTFAPAFNNIALDGEGFIMAVTYDGASEDMVFRLNSAGKNVLREVGNTPVMGDIHTMWGENSQFVDIAVTEYGTYAVVDRQRGRIFLYNFDGEMLNAFGSKGKLKGQFQMPSGIAWLGDKLLVSDSMLKCVYILTPTDFGRIALRASEAYYYGRWDEALELFKEAIRLNSNYEIAYTGIGKNYLMKDDYEMAMYYFKLGDNREFYSKAYNGYRSQVLKENFGIVMAIFVVVIGAIVISEIRYHKKGGRKTS
jgi:sugar lactone lactonase YvrE